MSKVVNEYKLSLKRYNKKGLNMKLTEEFDEMLKGHYDVKRENLKWKIWESQFIQESLSFVALLFLNWRKHLHLWASKECTKYFWNWLNQLTVIKFLFTRLEILKIRQSSSLLQHTNHHKPRISTALSSLRHPSRPFPFLIKQKLPRCTTNFPQSPQLPSWKRKTKTSPPFDPPLWGQLVH